MVCSACGYQNQVGNRFCGMCGTPLPHRPLTAPGANSTLSLTRVPLENSRSTRAQDAPSAPQTQTGALVETPQPVDRGSERPAPEQVADEPAPKELVPDLPLHEYVQNFRYQPPSDPTEITMRGDAHVLEPEAPVTESTTVEAQTSAAPGAPAAEVRAPSQPEIVAATDTDSRLGLEPESPDEARIQRPRFLDINEPAGDSTSAASGTSTIVGPSFLGLSDAPQVTPDITESEVAEVPARSHWRLWLAAAVVLVFAALGVMEWRSQVNQTDSGPVQMIKMKIRNWRHGAPPPAREPSSPAASTDTNSKPEIQVQEQPKPAGPDQTGAAPGAAATNANTNTANPAPQGAAVNPPATPAPGSKSNAPAQPAAAAGAGSASQSLSQPSGTPAPAAKDNTTGQATTAPSKPVSSPKTAQSPGEKPAPSHRTDQAEDQEVTVRQIVPGADEMAKAKNASDSAAEAAWLWKAMATGNPDAPIQLADMYVKGDGVPRSCEQALVLLKTAAAKENARARNRLASMYATGNCVQRNRVEAYRWLSSALAANPNSQWAQQNRDLIWRQMTPDERLLAEKYH